MKLPGDSRFSHFRRPLTRIGTGQRQTVAMGRTKAKTRYRGRRRPGVTTPRCVTLQQVLDAAQGELEQFRLEEARQLLTRALDMKPDCVPALEMSAGLLLDLGEMKSACSLLQRAVQLEPLTGPCKFLSLAQLLQGREAADCYSKAVELLTAEAEASPAAAVAAPDGPSAARRLSCAFCALAELYMTDLCDEPDAETLCRNYVARAVSSDPSNPEAHQTEAGLLLVTGDTDGARTALRRSTDLWLPAFQAARAGTAAGDPLEVCPLSYDLRLATVRSLIEVGCWETAEQVLDGLTEEDDEVVETWYLLALAAFEQGGETRASARPYLERARQAAAQNPDQQNPEMTEHVQQMLDELGPSPAAEQEEEEGGEDEWTDDEDEEMEMDGGGG